MAALLSLAMLALASGSALGVSDGADPSGAKVISPAAVVDEGDACVRSTDPQKSVARLWNEAALDAIRRSAPAPTIHARNLFHLSAAMWDAWAAYDPTADGVFVDEKYLRRDPEKARDKAVSYAAYRLLHHRYQDAVNGDESLRQYDELMAALCYPTDRTSTTGVSAAAVGNRIAKRVIGTTVDDGSLEAEGYASGAYAPVNEPLVVEQPGTVLADPNRWQPLELTVDGDSADPAPAQRFLSPQWGYVSGFALPEALTPGMPFDPGTPPYLHDAATDAQYKAEAVEVVRYSSMLDPRDGITVDISPASFGNAPLSTNDWTGYRYNPATGEPYEPVLVPRGDYGRAIAEFWADGPESESPPGHWNTLANAVVDHPEFEARIGGEGPELDPLEWDVKMYLALNGAVHDAAVAAWGAKAHYDYVRPISMIRYMGGLGQSSDPMLPSYHPDGLPLIEGEVELVTEASTAPGQAHEHLADHVGEIAIRAWTGNPGDATDTLAGVDWMRAVEWVPYQLSTFVTPSFAGYVSGHSTFSRAAAEVLAAMTGSPFFPGGMGTWMVPAGSFLFEAGPSVDVPLQWATYYDAADQAGVSRLYGGIHVSADDLRGRHVGSLCGLDAWATAKRYFEGPSHS